MKKHCLAAPVSLLILFSGLLVSGQGTGPRFATIDEMTEQLKAAPCKNSDRLAAVRKLFESMGANEADISIIDRDGTNDLVVTKKGKTDETVIVGAHYDKVHDGCGAIDNWTGIVTIANVYRTFRDLSPLKTYQFVAFDKEEPGLYGSAAFVKAIPKEQKVNKCWMVNIDSLGFAPVQVMDNTSSSKMEKEAESLAQEMKMPFGHAPITGANADSSSFLQKDIPAVTFHGMNNEWPKYLHSDNDKFANINVQMVFNAYAFVLKYLSRLDARDCGDFRK